MQRDLDAPVTASPVLRGAFCALGALLMMALMGTTVRMASTEIPNEMVVFLRNAFGLLALWPWIGRVGLPGLATDQWAGHLLRSLTGLSAMYCFCCAIARLDLASCLIIIRRGCSRVPDTPGGARDPLLDL